MLAIHLEGRMTSASKVNLAFYIYTVKLRKIAPFVHFIELGGCHRWSGWGQGKTGRWSVQVILFKGYFELNTSILKVSASCSD